MNGPDEILSPQRLRVLQIIALALLLGVLGFLAVALYVVLVQNNGQGIAPPQDLPIQTLVAAAMFAVLAPLSFLLPSIQTRSAVQRIAAGTWRPPVGVDPKLYGTVPAQLLAVRQSTLLVGLALLEGTAFMGCVAFLSEGQPLVLALVGAAVLLMLLRFPTAGRERAWLERQADQLAQLRP
jgi:hypothetical protein